MARGGTDGGVDGLSILGLRPGEGVRWRSVTGRRWRPGTVSHRESDGSIAVADESGGARSLPVDAILVSRPGPRGGLGWEPLAARAGRCEQLALFDLSEPTASARRRAGRAGRAAR